MRKLSPLAIAAVAATIFGATGCVSRADIEEIKKDNKDILAKLDAIQKAGGAGRPMGPQGPQPGQPDPAKTYAVPVGDSPAHGPEDAWVTIVEFSEFQCPFCKRVAPTIKEVEQKFGGDVRVVFKHNPLPFHNRAMFASNAAECAREQGKFWEMYENLFEGQPKLEDADLEGYATKAGVDLNNFKACIAAKKGEPRIQADQRLGAQMGARGTPAFFINGRFLSGAQPFASFEQLINQELDKAKKSGTNKREYYAKEIIAKGEAKL